MIKNVSDPSIASILSTDALKVYTIPRYQREYTWGQRDWANLYDDVFDNDPGYFLGSIIVIQGEIDPRTNIVDFEVIDGQQPAAHRAVRPHQRAPRRHRRGHAAR